MASGQVNYTSSLTRYTADEQKADVLLAHLIKTDVLHFTAIEK